MKSVAYGLMVALVAIFATTTSTPAAAMTQSKEMAAKSHKVVKHKVVHRTVHPKMKQGACRHKGHC
jgi:hypothetical protein